MQNPFRYFNSSPEVIRLAVMMYVRYPLSLRQVEDLLFRARHRTSAMKLYCFWWNRFGPLFVAESRMRRLHHRSFSRWRWHLDEVFVRIQRRSTLSLAWAVSEQTDLSRGREIHNPLPMLDSFRYFNSSPEVIRLTVMMYIRYPLSLR